MSKAKVMFCKMHTWTGYFGPSTAEVSVINMLGPLWLYMILFFFFAGVGPIPSRSSFQ